VTITNRLGLHARPAMVFVEAAKRFSADVRVRRCDQDEAVDGKSIMEMMMLAATCGTEIEITATSDDAESVVQELADLVENRFSEE
jgi:phosphocarrier protein